MPLMTIADIRARYPHPKAPTGRGLLTAPTDYCIGGALCLSQGRGGRFPSCAYLTRVLMAMQPALRWPEADRFAQAIIAYNDAGDFEAAWQRAADALSYGPPPARSTHHAPVRPV